MRGLVTRLRRTRHADPAPVVTPPPGPAGLEPHDPAVAPDPSFRDRGRLRRRLRYLRRVRELGFRDLGGLVFDLHRFGRRGDALVAQKLGALVAVDQELRALERALGDVRPFHELREPGLGACPRCAAIHGSDARFCPSCGTSLTGPLAVGEIGGAGAPATGMTPPSPAAASISVPAPAAPPSPPAPVQPPAVPDAAAGSTPVSEVLESGAQETQALGVVDPGSAADDQTPAPQDGDAGPATPDEPPASADAPAVTPPGDGSEDITVVQRPGDRES